MAIGAGLKYRFPNEFNSLDWGVLLWGEHWFIRAAVSLVCSAWAGFVAGIVGRNRGSILGVISVFPAWIIWVIMEYTALTGNFPFRDFGEVYISLGSKLSMGAIILATFPIVWHTGSYGELIGKDYSDHFEFQGDIRYWVLNGITIYGYQ